MTKDEVIAGALFDFMGWLTSRKERIVLSSADEASPAVDAIKDFAKMRGLSLDNAQVQTWQEALAQPAPVAITVRIWRDENGDQNAEFRGWHTLPDGEHIFYTTPPAQPALVSEYECRKLLYGFMLDCNTVGLEQAGKNLHRSMKEKNT